MSNIYFDAEFTGLHRNTTLISIGMVSENSGAVFYAEFSDYDKSQVDEWIQKHVIDNLIFKDKRFYISPLDKRHTIRNKSTGEYHFSTIVKADKDEVKERLLSWLSNEAKYSDSKLQFYTDCYAYDWMLLNDLICEDGHALNIPSYINYIPIDLSTYMQMNSIDPDINREEYITSPIVDVIKKEHAFELLPIDLKGDIKHNSLWDAMIIKYCFDTILVRTWTRV